MRGDALGGQAMTQKGEGVKLIVLLYQTVDLPGPRAPQKLGAPCSFSFFLFSIKASFAARYPLGELEVAKATDSVLSKIAPTPGIRKAATNKDRTHHACDIGDLQQDN